MKCKPTEGKKIKTSQFKRNGRSDAQLGVGQGDGKDEEVREKRQQKCEEWARGELSFGIRKKIGNEGRRRNYRRSRNRNIGGG
jgi:hypothetical protein